MKALCAKLVQADDASGALERGQAVYSALRGLGPSCRTAHLSWLLLGWEGKSLFLGEWP